jgi:hypothetical protein
VGLVALTLSAPIACLAPPEDGEVTEGLSSALSGANEAGYNLSGANLAGANLAGANLAGANLGGANLAGNNLAGNNLAGTNLGGNNLAGSNLAGSNLAGANLAGSNLAGANLAGSNLAGSNLAGSNLAGTNLAGNNLAGTNLAGANLAGANTGFNLHNLTSVTGMLYSGEDRWSPKTAQCVVMGMGSTAFPKLLGQQSANAKISVALGKLPWGFSATAGGPVTLRAWEATVWGDKTYCVFLLAAPPEVTWAGVAGFMKAVFRWNAPPTQTMEMSGIEASRPHDPTVNTTTIVTYTGMMNAAARQRAGTISAKTFVAGELGFITATTNNQSVMVDFSSWALGTSTKGVILGNVQSVNPPTYVESVYYTVENPDGTVAVKIFYGGVISVPGITISNFALDVAYKNYLAGKAMKPVPRRCAGALLLKFNYGEPVPAGKCDNGLSWQGGGATTNSKHWDTESGTTAPMNQYMEMPLGGTSYFRRGPTADTMLKVLSETYVHLWDKSFDVPVNPSCTPDSDAAICSRLSPYCGALAVVDNCGAVRQLTCPCP